MDDLTKQKCIPCEGGTDPMGHNEIEKYLAIVTGWRSVNDKAIEREFEFANFIEVIKFINKVASIAENEGHHPDFLVHDYKKIKIMLSTHAIEGLSMNDFIMAAKINKLKNG